ncbi:hypothetical protein FGO68_gene3624 [Halteria grandinella]|uniref:Uncharacterized protein n=1 Tax=Halteria grandinella TaxID=5974 RepID=A0A8J8T2D7_HALGN|nr:hypothetical protein FGO68_gene3624 [Halteria grandinella]
MIIIDGFSQRIKSGVSASLYQQQAGIQSLFFHIHSNFQPIIFFGLVPLWVHLFCDAYLSGQTSHEQFHILFIVKSDDQIHCAFV